MVLLPWPFCSCLCVMWIMVQCSIWSAQKRAFYSRPFLCPSDCWRHLSLGTKMSEPFLGQKFKHQDDLETKIQFKSERNTEASMKLFFYFDVFVYWEFGRVPPYKIQDARIILGAKFKNQFWQFKYQFNWKMSSIFHLKCE